MKLLVATLSLVNLLLCSAHVVPTYHHALDCDDPEAHQAAAVAVQHINAQRHSGYLLTLNRVEKIFSLPSHGADEFYGLELDLLETQCPAVSPTAPENCAVRPLIEQAVEADCDFRMRKHNNSFEVVHGRCKSELKSVEKTRRICPHCPLIAPLDDARVVHAVDVALNKFNGENHTNHFYLHEIGRGRVQKGASDTTIVEFVAIASNCTKQQVQDGATICAAESGPNVHYASCSGTVVKPPVAGDEEVTVKCAVHAPQPRKDAPAPKPAPLPAWIRPSRFHHQINYNTVGIYSAESHSAEQALLAAHSQRTVKRSLTGEPVAAGVTRAPICPGRKIHF